MMILSMISEVHFFNSALFGKTVLLKNSKNINVTLKKHTPLKKRYVRSNQAPFVNKTITKEIKKQSHLRNKFLNIKSEIEKHIKSNITTALLFLEKHSKHSLAMLIQLM